MSTRSPRYLDVAGVLQEEINLLAPNSLLPTEQQLARRFGVSRITVRGALDLLEKSGLVSRLRGRGTTVSPPKITRRFAPLQSFEQDLASQGIEFETIDVMEDPAAFEHMEKISGQTLAPVIEVDGKVLADFGARELVVFWEGLGKE